MNVDRFYTEMIGINDGMAAGREEGSAHERARIVGLVEDLKVAIREQYERGTSINVIELRAAQEALNKMKEKIQNEDTTKG